jgi:hypothetical protein
LEKESEACGMKIFKTICMMSLYTTVLLSHEKAHANLDDNWVSIGNLNSNVYALAVDRTGVLYAGGSFSSAGGTSANNIAQWDGATWSPLGIGTNGTVDAVIVDRKGNLFAGGTLHSTEGITANFIAEWSSNSWRTVGNGLGCPCEILPLILPPCCTPVGLA